MASDLPTHSIAASTPPPVASNDLSDRVRRLQGVGGAQLESGLAAVFDRVDGEDPARSRDARALDRRQAHPAAADDGDGLAPAHGRRLGGGAEPRHNGAADETCVGSRNLTAYRDGHALGNNDVLAERPQAHEAVQRPAVPTKKIFRSCAHPEPAAQLHLAPNAWRAGSASRRPGENHTFAFSEPLNSRAEGGHDACSLVPENSRETDTFAAVDCMQVTAANATSLDLDAYIPRPGIG